VLSEAKVEEPAQGGVGDAAGAQRLRHAVLRECGFDYRKEEIFLYILKSLFLPQVDKIIGEFWK
jgi:hypothetical protein